MDGRQLLKQYDHFKEQAQFYRDRCYHLEGELRVVNPALYRAQQQINHLERQAAQLQKENKTLRRQLADLKGQLDLKPRNVPAFVKANVPVRRGKGPGRPAGHPPARRARPQHIDQHLEVPWPKDAQGVCSCPQCHAQLQEIQRHQRLVEDILPPKLVVTCYHTVSGYCPGCRRRIESRAPEQPPAAGVAASQIGLNALATAALLRVQYRLPYRLISQLLADLPGLHLSPAALARQMQRLGQWLEGEYDRLKVFLRFAPAVHMDETSWRVDGHNQWLWTLLDERHTLFHVAPSRGQKVVQELLGEVFGGTLVSDFYSAYGTLDCRKQKCLVHLLRELRDTAAQNPDFARGPLRRRLKRVLKELFLLRRQRPKLSARVYEVRGRRLEARLKELARTCWQEADAERIAARLRKHEKELTVFLWDPAVDPDNNAAERALRPAVVLRKITGGSRSQRGARATAVLMSVVRTALQQDRPLLETIRTLIQNAWAGINPGLLTDVLANTS